MIPVHIDYGKSQKFNWPGSSISVMDFSRWFLTGSSEQGGKRTRLLIEDHGYRSKTTSRCIESWRKLRPAWMVHLKYGPDKGTFPVRRRGYYKLDTHAALSYALPEPERLMTAQKGSEIQNGYAEPRYHLFAVLPRALATLTSSAIAAGV